MTLISDDFISYAPYSAPQSIYLANKSVIDAVGEGTVKLFTTVNGMKHKVHLHNTLLVPTLANSLFSMKTVNHLGFSACFRPYVILIENPSQSIIAESEEGGNLYDLSIMHDPVRASTARLHDSITLDVLHKCLGHPNLTTLQ